MSPTSLSSMNVFQPTIHNSELIVGNMKEGAHTQSLSLFAPAWNTTLQSWTLLSTIPFGTAKYLIRDLMHFGGWAMYFRSMNFLIFFLITSFSSGFNLGWGCLEVRPLHVNITRTPRLACVWYRGESERKVSLTRMGIQTNCCSQCAIG